MTAPLSFPQLSPVAPRPQEDDGSRELLTLLLNVQQQRRQNAFQREELDRARRESDERLAASQENRAASKEQREQAKLAFEQGQRTLDASDTVANELASLLGTNRWTPEAQSAARVRLIQQNPKLANEINVAFDSQVQAHEKSRVDTAQRIKAEAEAREAVALETPKITIGKRQPQVQQAQLSAAHQQLAASQATIRSMAISRWLETPGATWRTFREDFSLPPGIMADDAVSPAAVPQAGDKLTEAQRTSLLAARQMLASEALLTPAVEQAGSVTLKSQLRRTTKSATVDAFLNTFSDPTQRTIVRAQLGFMGGYILTMSGKAATDAEVLRSVRAMLEGYGDNDAASLQNARFLRQSMMSGAFAVSQNQTTPFDAMNESLAIAKAMKMPQATVAFLQKMRDEAAARAEQPGASLNPAVTRVDQLLNEAFPDSTARRTARPKPFPPR